MTSGQSRILVDTGPDLREQLLDADISDLSAVIWTHDHADHCHGIDELRQIYNLQGAPVEGFARHQTLATLCRRFAYVFEGRGGYPATASAKPLPDRLEIGNILVRTVDQPHGRITSAGLRFDSERGSIAYSTDFNELTPEMGQLFEGVDIWVVDALRRRPHPTHPHLDQVLQWVSMLRPKRAILTHMDHSMDYATLCSELPDGVEPGFDGLEIDL